MDEVDVRVYTVRGAAGRVRNALPPLLRTVEQDHFWPEGGPDAEPRLRELHDLLARSLLLANEIVADEEGIPRTHYRERAKPIRPLPEVLDE